ncbi:MAG TPA: hypothetical protein VIG57_02290 [Candidatus Entotheonella sp.]|jgi:hypothetical protein
MVERIRLPDTWAAIEHFFAQEWSDGLPVVPPTESLVSQMLDSGHRDPSEVIGHVPPRFGEATVESVAVHAVMAGCQAAYFPVVLAALEALLDPRFGLHGVIATTHVSTPLLIVNGPIVRELDINAGYNLFGQGWRANATIGRATRLVLNNLGGAVPGGTDQSTLGHPGKFTYCIAENEVDSPWPPLHVERGFAPDDSTVTVLAAAAPYSMSDFFNNTALGIMRTFADCMSNTGSANLYRGGEMLVVVGPEHARDMSRDGWSKTDIKYYLYEYARKPYAEARLGGMYSDDVRRDLWPRWIDYNRADVTIPLVRTPDEILVIYGGGAGRHSAWVPGWGNVDRSRTVTRKIVR